MLSWGTYIFSHTHCALRRPLAYTAEQDGLHLGPELDVLRDYAAYRDSAIIQICDLGLVELGLIRATLSSNAREHTSLYRTIVSAHLAGLYATSSIEHGRFVFHVPSTKKAFLSSPSLGEACEVWNDGTVQLCPMVVENLRPLRAADTRGDLSGLH